MRKRQKVLFASLCFALGLLVYSPGASGLPSDPKDSPTWVEFNSFDHELTNSKEVYIQGWMTKDGGCAWTEDVGVEMSSGAIEGREIGIDTKTCLVLMEYGIPPQSAIDAFLDDPPVDVSPSAEGQT